MSKAKIQNADTSLEIISSDYDACADKGQQFINCLKHEIGTLISENDIALGADIEGRVKKLDSILDKVIQKKSEAKTPFDITDFVGIRVILLFRKDILNIDKIIKKNFDVVEFEKTDVRLSENEFGYQSNHYLIKLKKKWCSIPSYKNFTGIVAELQVRTMAQHIWASISHKLQYKNEVSIPSPMRRTIHRVSALLETVDLEFDRVLKERNAYLKGINTEQDQEINVDLLIRIGDDYFPKEDEECAGFESLLQDLNHFQIKTLSVLKSLLDKHLDGIMDADQNQAKIALTDETYTNFHEKAVKGRFYSHVGLFRQALRLEYGDEAVNDLFKFRSSKFLAEDENELPI